jgi:hypothetical protein
MKIRVFILNQYLLAFTLCSITALSGPACQPEATNPSHNTC